ncbi:MAG: hypothetical protein ACKVRP_10150 [Bacteroidota bacterium]
MVKGMKQQFWLVVGLVIYAFSNGSAQESSGMQFASPVADSALNTPAADQPRLNAWGMDILISNDGFGLGTFYRREFTPDLFGFVNFSISESKDGREVERYDPYTQVPFVPGKLNRFLVMPLLFGLQQRLFREDIMDTFRPYINAGAGPTLIFAAPFTEITQTTTGFQTKQVEFFKSLGKGQAHYTASAFIGAGANFGSDKNNLFGVNFRYYFTYLFSDGLPSLYNERSGEVAGTKKDFGGFFITLNVGLSY